MAAFILGLTIFFGAHLFAAFARKARERLSKRLGEGPYKGLNSLVSILGFALIVWGWRNADATPLYVTPYWLRHVMFALVLAALILVAAAYLPKGRIAHAARHPFLSGVALWALAHLLVNGEVRSLILFGSFLGFAVIDRYAVARRSAAVPAKGPVINDAYALVVGPVAWVAIYFLLHSWLAGVALRP